MVQILPQKTDVGSAIGAGLGQGLGQGFAQGSQIGFQRNLIQNSMKDLENLPPETTPAQLASKLIQATAGIPGAERYVGQIFPLLLNQMKSKAAFPGSPQSGNMPGQPAEQGNEGQPPSQTGGILGSVISQQDIDKEATRYAEATGTGLEGYNQMQQNLMNRNTIAEQQRAQAEAKAKQLGVPDDEINQFMLLGQKHQGAKTFDDWARETQKSYLAYKNLTKSLDAFSYPGLWKGKFGREERLGRLDNTVKRLVDMGFEQEVRQKLHDKSLSPTEIEERIHPLSEKTSKQLGSLPDKGLIPSAKKDIELGDKVKNFLKGNIDNNTSLLVLRDKLWKKGYDWHDISKWMNEVVTNPTVSQKNELGILENEPPRQSLGFIFNDWGNFIDTARGQR